MVMLTDCLDMAIDVDLAVKPDTIKQKTKQTKIILVIKLVSTPPPHPPPPPPPPPQKKNRSEDNHAQLYKCRKEIPGPEVIKLSSEHGI